MKKINIKHAVIPLSGVFILAFVFYSLRQTEDPSIKNRSMEYSREMRSMRLVLSNGQEPAIPDFTETGIENSLKALTRKKFIRDVIIEKATVCAGEDFEVRVVLENQEGPDSELVCMLGDKFSTTAFFKYPGPGNQVIDIYVRDNQRNIDTRSLAIQVIDCPEKAALFINETHSERAAEEIDFEIIEKKGIACPCAYEWEFGDGTVQTAVEERISHDYGKRPQDAFSSTFIVSVKATDKDGIKATARTSITLMNARFISKQVGYAVVPIIYDTRPEVVDGAYSIQVKIKNIYDDPITFNEATISKKNMETGEIVEQETVSAGSIMKKREIKNGEIAEDMISIPSRMSLDSASIMQIVLVGTFPDNTSGKGMIFLFKENK